MVSGLKSECFPDPSTPFVLQHPSSHYVNLQLSCFLQEVNSTLWHLLSLQGSEQKRAISLFIFSLFSLFYLVFSCTMSCMTFYFPPLSPRNPEDNDWYNFLFICLIHFYLLQGNKSQLGRWDSGWRAWRVQQTRWRPTHLCRPAVSSRKCLCQVPYYSHCCCLCQRPSWEMVCRLVLDGIRKTGT